MIYSSTHSSQTSTSERAQENTQPIFAAPPCSTYSVARFFQPQQGRQGAPVVRTRAHILGVPDLAEGHKREVARANEMTRRTALILSAAGKAEAEFAVENPADQGDHSHRLHTVPVRRARPHLARPPHGRPQKGAPPAIHHLCSMHAWWSRPEVHHHLAHAGIARVLRPLRGLICRHPPGTHTAVA